MKGVGEASLRYKRLLTKSFSPVVAASTLLVALSGVIIDGTGTAPVADQNITIDGGTIAAIKAEPYFSRVVLQR